MSEKQKYIDFEAYERVAEPHKRERVSAWRTAIGLQDVDGLRRITGRFFDPLKMADVIIMNGIKNVIRIYGTTN